MNNGTENKKTLRILHIEDSPCDAEIVRERLIDAGFSLQLDWATNEHEFTTFLQSGGYDLVLADYHLPDFDGTAALRLSQTMCPGVPYISVSGAIGEDKAVELLKQGATDYVSKDRLDRLPLAMERALDEIAERTARKVAEHEKNTLQEQLNQAQKMESVGRLAGGVAHDFNNMLTVILGHAQLGLMHLEPDHPVCSNLTEISKTAERSADLTRQLLAFARKQTIAPKVLDLNETVSGMLKMLQRMIGEDIKLNWHPAPNLWPVKLDPSQIDQILANLCVNARDSIADVGKILIEMGNIVIDEEYCTQNSGFMAGEYVRLAVSDNGCGMDKATQVQIFEPFFTTKGPGEGTGLGLATVYGIVKQNNGFINVYSEPGLGTTFTMYLPRYSGEAEQIRTEGTVKPPRRGMETILLVEDEPAILKITATILKKQGYTILAASTPVEAIRLAREHVDKIHLLMTDVVMPEMNGKDLANTLQSLCPQLKCLFMSGYTSDVIAHHGVLNEGVYFIQKPYSVSELATKVRAVLDRE